jgi:Na+/glutamate symporter
VKHLLGAAAAFTGTVVAGFVVGLFLWRATGASWWVAAGLLGGLGLGIVAIAAALRPFLRSN